MIDTRRSTDQLDRYADLLIEVAQLLMASGATTSRVEMTLGRFGDCLNIEMKYVVSLSSITISIKRPVDNSYYTRVAKMPGMHIDFTMISGISRASWTALSENWSVEQMENELVRLKGNRRYSRWTVLVMVSLAGAGFCYNFDGDAINQVVTFIATFCGLFLRQEMVKRKYNGFVAMFFAALVASCIASLGVVYQWGISPEMSLATSVLFLVPGIPLINSFCDIFEGATGNGMMRLAEGAMGAFALSMGLFVAMMLFEFNIIR